MLHPTLDMDIDDWEFLSDNAGQKRGTAGLDPRDGVVDMSYFTVPPLPPVLLQEIHQDSSLPVTENESQDDSDSMVEDEIGVASPDPALAKISEVVESEINIATPMALANVIYQAFFNASEAEGFSIVNHDNDNVDKEQEEEEEDGIGAIQEKKGFFSIIDWVQRSRGVKELRSFGVAAATLCIFALSGHLGFQQKQRQIQNRKLQLQICNDHKAKQAMEQTASAVGGASMPRARLSFGGYFQASNPTKSLLDDMLL